MGTYDLVKLIQSNLSNDLRRFKYRANPNPVAGHCYVASECAFHALGGYLSVWRPYFIKHENDSHWFLMSVAGEILDPTSSQFKTPVPYLQGRRASFLTKLPSKRTQILLSRLGLSPKML